MNLCPRKKQIGIFTASIYNKEQKQSQSEVECGSCMEKGHTRKKSEKKAVCYSCRMPGHKKGSIACPAFIVKPRANMHYHGMAGKMGMQMNAVPEVEDEHECESESVPDHESRQEGEEEDEAEGEEEDKDVVVEGEIVVTTGEMEEEKREKEMKDDDKSKESELNTSKKNLGTEKRVPENNSEKCQDEKAVKEKNINKPSYLKYGNLQLQVLH